MSVTRPGRLRTGIAGRWAGPSPTKWRGPADRGRALCALSGGEGSSPGEIAGAGDVERRRRRPVVLSLLLGELILVRSRFLAAHRALGGFLRQPPDRPVAVTVSHCHTGEHRKSSGPTTSEMRGCIAPGLRGAGGAPGARCGATCRRAAEIPPPASEAPLPPALLLALPPP